MVVKKVAGLVELRFNAIMVRIDDIMIAQRPATTATASESTGCVIHRSQYRRSSPAQVRRPIPSLCHPVVVSRLSTALSSGRLEVTAWLGASLNDVDGCGGRRHTSDVGCLSVPRLAEFYGIVIYMYWSDHAPPHFHAVYAGDEAQIRIDDGSELEGSLPRTAARLVREWAELRRTELLADWDRAQRPEPLEPIDSLR